MANPQGFLATPKISRKNSYSVCVVYNIKYIYKLSMSTTTGNTLKKKLVEQYSLCVAGNVYQFMYQYSISFFNILCVNNIFCVCEY